MRYITSRRFTLPESPDEFATFFWFNLWRRRLWPYRELLPGDILYWYESSKQHIVWKSRVVEVDRFPYESREEVRVRLEDRFGEFDTTQPYFVNSPEQGYCLAWRALPIERLRLPKPLNVHFPREGWLRVDDDVALQWLGETDPMDDVVLDNLVPHGTLLETIHQLNRTMAQVSPERIRSVVMRTVRRDTHLVRALKELCGFRCQFPNCGVRIPKRGGGFYIEVAHIQPVSQGGQSVLGNLLVLCPNHHKAFDYGDLEIVEQTAESIRGTLNGMPFEIRLPGVGAPYEGGTQESASE